MKSIVATAILVLAIPAFAQDCITSINTVGIPDAPVIAGDPFTLTADASFTGGSLAPNSYEWFKGDSLIGSGPSITLSETDTTSYTLQVSGACGDPVTAQVVVPLNKGACAGNLDQLCINDVRYRITLTATDADGNQATGFALYSTNEFGYFSLPSLTGDASAPEVLVKVLGPVDGVPWVFYSGLTNLDYTITVSDTLTGQDFNSYHVAAPDAGSEISFGNYDVDGSSSQQCSQVAVETDLDVSPAACANTASSLCLLNRFLITMNAQDNPVRSDATGDGVALAAGSNFGFFSVPALSGDPRNVESFVKMIDAGGSFWLFMNGLTDLSLNVTAVDTVTGVRRTYTKPAGSTCGINDTSAF